MDRLTDPSGRNITTARLTLRRWRGEDEQSMLALSTDPEVMRYFPRPMTAEEVHEFVGEQRARPAGRPGRFAVETRADSRFIGFVGLAEAGFEAPFTPCVEVGWRLVKAAWGQGFATEAARAALDHGFDNLGLDEVVSFTAVVNSPSIAVMRRLGMRRDPDGDFDHPRVEPGQVLRRHVLYRLRAEERTPR